MARMPTGRFTTVLDAGCGDGHHALEIARRFPHVNVTGIDLNMDGRPASSHLPPNASLLRGDLLGHIGAEMYDFIYSIDVLEHIPDNMRALDNICGAVKKGGYLFLHLPAGTERKGIFPACFLKDFYSWAEDEHIGEFYTLQEMESALRNRGFEIKESRHTFGFVGVLAWELDRMTDGNIVAKTLMMPLLKGLGRLSVALRPAQGDLLLVATKFAGSS